MLYRANASEFPFWVYYVKMITDPDVEQEVFVFRRNEGKPFGLYLNQNEHYFLYIYNPSRIFDTITEDGKVYIDRYNSQPNWKIYLWGKDLVALSSKVKNLELVNESL